ncbi:DUF2147 domain-containing protein [Lysobacter tyrosinilyticus]
MRNTSKLLFSLLALPLLAAATMAGAQSASSPVGRWKTYDEDTGKPRLIVDVYEAKGGTIAAKVVDTLFTPNALCTACSGAAKNKPIKDMVIFWGLKPDGDEFSGGTVLKLSNGKTYKSKAKLVEGGRKLEVYGCVSFICKHQTWTRE